MATLVAALTTVLAVALTAAPTAAAAAGDTSGCGFAPDGSGTYADTICWIDLSGYDDAQARSAAGQPFTLNIGDYTVHFTARTTDIAGVDRPPSITASGTPTWADGTLGNRHEYTDNYAGIPGKPAWLIHHENFTPGVDVGAQLSLTDIAVTDPSGANVTSYAFIFGEAESSSQNEHTTWQSNKSINFLQTLNPSGDRGCDRAILTGLGTDSVTCPGRGPDGAGNWSSVLLRTDAPTTVSQAITTTSNNGSAFGIMVSRLQLTKAVDGRIKGSDSFDVSVTTPDGGQLATASTGGDDSATTGPVLVLPRNDGQGFTLGEAGTPGTGTDLTQYNRSWACTRNGQPDAELSAATGTSQVVSPAVGDFIDCTITNTAPPALTCDPGTIYALGGDGTIVAIPTDSIDDGAATSTRIGNMAPASNDLAIAQDGSAAYAFSRDTGEIVKYSSGGVVQTFDDSAVGDTSQAFGGIDPVNGIYYFGGNNPDGTITIFGWNTSSDTPVGDGSAVATISLPTGQTSTTGDLAFDALGNLYFTAADGLFRVDGQLPTTSSNEALDSTRIATLPAPDGDSYGAIAFASNGYLYIGSGGGTSNHWLKVNPNTGDTEATSVAGAASAQDFASCQYPSTLQAQKDVVGRQRAGDQFTISITGSGVSAGNTTTTSGGANGIQPNIAGPVLAVGGSTYHVAETAAGTSVLDQYTATYSCIDTLDNGAEVTSGTGTSFDLTMDANPDQMGIVCTFTNSPIAPGYTVVKSASEHVAHPGDTVTYTVTVANTGPVPYTADDPAAFTDDLSQVLDDAVYDDDASATAGAATYGEPTLSWSGPLAPKGQDGDTVTITYTVTVNQPDSGDGTLTNAADPTRPGGVCPDGSAPPCPPVHVLVQSYTVAKSATPAQTAPGGTVTYTIKVVNTGQVAYTADDPASFTDDLSEVLDDATYDNDADHGATYSGGLLSWSGPLDVGDSVTITYTVTVNTPDTGDGQLVNAASPPSDNGGGCAPDGTAPPCPPTIVPVLSYSVTKSASTDVATAGDTVTYTIEVTNTGQNAYTADNPASFTDDLSKVLDDATYNKDASASAGPAPGYDAPALSWSGPLPVGATVTITYTVTVHAPDRGDHELTNAANPTGFGGTCADGSAAPCSPVNVPVRELHVVKKADKSSTHPGDTVTYTITLTNTGKADFTAGDPASFTDDMAGVLDDAVFNDDAVSNGGGTLTYHAPRLSWQGALAAGKSVTVAYTVTVNDPDTGDGKLHNVVTTPHDPSGASVGNCPANSSDPDCRSDLGVEGAAATASLAGTGNGSAWQLALALVLLGAGGLLALAGVRRRRN